MVTAILGTSYASKISSFKRVKDGRRALLVHNAQLLDAVHWDKEVKVHDVVFRDWVFNGHSRTTMHTVAAAHRATLHVLQRCATNATCNIPDGREHVIIHTAGMAECNDANVKAALANSCLNDSPAGI